MLLFPLNRSLTLESLLAKKRNAQVRRPAVSADDGEDNEKFVFNQTDAQRCLLQSFTAHPVGQSFSLTQLS